jgi:hypothetical protein
VPVTAFYEVKDAGTTMMPAKKEDGDRDRLIESLKLTEGVEYRTVDVNVLNRPREKNFDYLLQANSGATLALEIT